MSDHSHYEELAALEAGGFLSDAERAELHEHAGTCLACSKAGEEFKELAHFGLPLTVGLVRESVDKMKTWPDSGIRSRFLRRARMEGIRFSQGVEGSIRHAGRRTGFLVAGAVAAMALIFAMVATTFYGPYRHSGSQDPLEAQQQVDQLKRENAALAASLTQLNESLLAGQRDLQICALNW